MRLGSGRVRSKCIMQFSLAAGSDRAVEGGSGARLRLGSWVGRPEPVPHQGLEAVGP